MIALDVTTPAKSHVRLRGSDPSEAKHYPLKMHPTPFADDDLQAPVRRPL